MASNRLHPRLLCIGDFAWDVVVKSVQPLYSGGDADGTVKLMPGGSCANVAVWFTRCVGKGSCRFIGRIGDDLLGRMARDNLSDEGILDGTITDLDHSTQTVAVLVDHTGQRSCITDPMAADHKLRSEDIDINSIENSIKYLHITSWSLFREPTRSAARYAIDCLKQRKIKVSLDPSSYQKISEMGGEKYIEITKGMSIDYFIPNLDEAAVLANDLELSTEDQIWIKSAECPHEWLEIAVKMSMIYKEAAILLKLGREGVLALYREGKGRKYLHVKLSEQQMEKCRGNSSILDTTGCGDAFAAGFLSRIDSLPLDCAIGYGCKLSSFVAFGRGARLDFSSRLNEFITSLNSEY